MIARVVAWSARHPRLVVAAALLAALLGEGARRAMSRDVLPDLTSPQVVVVADWMGHPAMEVADALTGPLAGALEGVPGATAVRGSSMAGMASVDVVFGSPASLPAGRQAILERVARVRPGLPATARVQVGPAASSSGWVFQYALTDSGHTQSLPALRRWQEQVLRPALEAIPGVAEVATVGGAAQEILIEPLAEQLRARAVAFSDVVAAARAGIGTGSSATPAEIGALPLPAAPAGSAAALRVSDVARVRIAEAMPSGVADLGGLLPAVGGIVVAARTAPLSTLIPRVRETLEQARARLPRGVRLETVYDRLDLAGRVQRTLLTALGEEVAVVVLVVLAFLLHARSALVPLATLPLVVLATFAAMWALGVPATVMSLGGIGIALGMAVDADIVALEACHRRLEALPSGATPGDRRAALVAAAGSFAPAILISLMTAALAFLPVFAFTGETGRLLRPLALTKTLVIASAALISVTLAPALRDRLLEGPVKPEFDNALTRTLVRIYQPFVRFALERPLLTLLTAAVAVASCIPIVVRLGGEFLPRVDEGDLLFMPTTLPGAPVQHHQTATELRRADRAIAQFPEVATVFGKIGRADTATDTAPYTMMETTVRLLPRAQWPTRARERWYSGWAPGPLRRALGLLWPEETAATTAELIEMLDRATRLPGWTGAWTAPIRARLDMMSTGVRTPVAVRVVTPDPQRLDALGAAVRAVVTGLPGTRSAVFESLGGEPGLELVLDARAAARFGVDPALAASTAALVAEGGQIGDVARDGERLRVRVLPEASLRGPADQLRELTVRASRGGSDQPVALGLVGHPRFVTRPASIRTERGELGAYVHVDLRDGVDPAGYVAAGRRSVDEAVAAGALALRPGERLEWAGQYELLAAGQRRLRWIVPAVVLSMLALLLLQFRSLTEAAIVLVSVPFALVGSFWMLYLLGYALSAPVWVGLLSVTGLAMQTGVVMVVYIDAAFHRRVAAGRVQSRDDIVAAHAEGTVQRLRPKVMTIATMAVSLLPLLWAEGAGSEIIRRVAAPMFGGLASSAFLTLEVLPVLYTLWRQRQLAVAQRKGVPVAEVVGRTPPWARS